MCKSERWSHYHALYCYPDTACATSLLLFFPFHFTLQFCPVTHILPVPLFLGHKTGGKVEEEARVENKENAQEEEERDAVIPSGKAGRRSR